MGEQDGSATRASRPSRSSRRSRAGATITEVALEAGVSLMTVSRVLNGKDNVRAETRERVQQAIKALNYSPSAAARNLAAASEVRIALLYSNPSAGYLNAFLVGSLDQAAQSNVQLVVQLCEKEEERGERVQRLIDSGVDGLILPPPLCDAEDIQMLLQKSEVPGVAVASGRPASFLSSVNIDDRAAAAMMTRHLIAQGHKRIGFIAGNPNQTASALRLQGYRDALNESGLRSERALIAQGLFTYRSGLDAAHVLLEQAKRPTAIFASNDDMAAAAVSLAHRMGIEVPRELTVVGFDDSPQATATWPELTTIRQPIADMSRAAVTQLVEHIRTRREGRSFAPRHT